MNADNKLTPWVLGLAFLCCALFVILFQTAKERDKEHDLRVRQIYQLKYDMHQCGAPVILWSSNDPVGAVPYFRYRDSQFGHGCVFLADGRYGDLWWSIVKEDQAKGHLEWNFTERGKYEW